MTRQLRKLELNPREFDVELREVEREEETEESHPTLTVDFRFGETTGVATFIPSEMERIGAWFTRAAKSLKTKRARK